LGCYNITSIKAYGLTPGTITLGADVFNSIPTNTCKLYVPIGTKALYAAADQWKDFMQIIEPTVNVTIPGTLGTLLTATQLSTITSLTVTGTIDARDFKTMRDKMPLLATLDLSGATIVAHTGTDGTVSANRTYPANEIPEFAFCFHSWSGKTSLTSISLPASTAGIGINAFEACTGLSFIDMPSSLSYISGAAFYNCPGLTTMTIPSSVTSIENNTFSYCTGLKTFTIPSSVTSIGSLVFQGCSGITSLNILAANPATITLNGDVFYGISKSTCKLVIPAASYMDYSVAAQWKDFFFVNTPTPATLGSFSTRVGTASASKTSSFSVSPIMLDMIITAPAGYEISESGTGTFGPSLTFTSPTGNIPAKNIEVRIAATAPMGSPAGNLICSSNGALQKSIALSGTVLPLTPTVTTQAVITNGSGTATANGNITDLGATNPTAYGVCWNTVGAPSITDNVKNNGAASVTGAYTAAIEGLAANTTYYVRAFATNSGGTTYGDEVTFTTQYASQTITFDALDNKTYGDLDYNPGAVSTTEDTNPITYTSSDAAVATIVSGQIHIVGPGVTNITASQDADATHLAAANVIQQLIVGKKALTISAVADTKTYDGTTVSIAVPTVGALASGDAINVAPTQAFDNASVGTTHVLTATGLTIKNGSTDVTGNYNISYVPATGTINKLSVTVAAAPDTKTYNGTTVSVAVPTVGALASGDAINAAPTQAFDNASVGTTHVLTATGLTIKNGSADVTGNYNISYVPATGTINKLSVIVAAAPDTKTYNGTTVSTVAPTVGALASGDAINAAPTQAFDNASVGTTHVLTATGLTIKNGSTDVTGNYNISYAPATGTINKLSVIVAAAPDTKTYNGTTVSTVAPSVGALAASDAINVAPTQAFDNASVGTTHVLTATGLTIKNGSTDVTGNYNISYVPASGTINKLSVIVAAAPDTKTYNGTTVSTVAPSVGTLVAGDAINVAPTQAFDNASVGTTHVLTATGLTIKNGSKDVTGNYDINYVPANGSIVPKPLTITAPVLMLNKVYDGNKIATITTTGALSGVVASDAGKVTVTAVASYDNATVGTNKTITVVYTLGSSAAVNYSAPADFVVPGAEIYAGSIVLDPLSNPTPNSANTGLVLSYSVVGGGPTQYQITFEEPALAVGIKNVSYTALVTTGTNGSISISVPAGTRPGKYKGTLQMRNDFGVESTVYAFVLTVNIPTEYIAVKYNRVLVLDNSTRMFSAYQWYKDGVAIEGATKQFYSDPKGLVGTYSIQATTTDGEILYSYPKVLNIPLIRKVTAYPTMVRANQTCTVEITDEAMDMDLTGAELSVYSTQGTRVYYSNKVEKVNSIQLPTMSGMYSGRLTTADGQSFLFKVIVAN